MNQSGLVVCVGELLIDFFCTDIDVNLVKGENFLKQAGGAPANVTAAIAKLGGKASFVGKVGNDPFGHFLIKTLDEVQVDTSMIYKDNSSMTTLAFVSLQGNGERDFVFQRGADERLSMDELDLERILSAKILHFGSATAMLGGLARETYFQLIKMAKEKDIFISFDPNFRGALWEGHEQEFIELANQGIQHADLVKVSEEELKLISNCEDLLEGVQKLHQLGGRVIAVTLGKEGTFISTGNEYGVIPSVAVKSIDSTGAGDAFIGAVLYQLSQMESPKEFSADFNQVSDSISFANKVGAIVCTKVGAISSLPTLNEVREFS